MYELQKGKMVMRTPNKKDAEMYKKAGWSLPKTKPKHIESKSKKDKSPKKTNNNINEVSVEFKRETTIE